MLLPITQYGSAVLRKPASRVPAVTPELRRLAVDMLETMYAAKGVGLAAQQVGRLESACVIDVPPECDAEDDRAFNAQVEMPLVMFNPEIVATSGEQEGDEGCLSFPKIGCKVKRPAEVAFRWLDAAGGIRTASARGFLARAVLHETDHLRGVLFIDRADEESKKKAANKLRKLAKANGNTI